MHFSASSDPPTTGQIHDTTGGFLSINVDPGLNNRCVPLGWDVIESVTIHIE